MATKVQGSQIELLPKDFQDGATYKLDRTVMNSDHDKRRRLPSSDYRAIERAPIDTAFKASVFVGKEEIAGLQVVQEEIQLKGQRGTLYEFTLINVRKTAVGDQSKVSVSPNTDFARDLVNALVPIEDPLTTLMALAAAKNVDGWDVVRTLVDTFSAVNLRQVEAAITSAAQASKRSKG